MKIKIRDILCFIKQSAIVVLEYLREGFMSSSSLLSWIFLS